MHRRTLFLVPALVLAVVGIASLGGCRTTYPQRDPTGEVFPSVVGESLEGDEVALPSALSGEPALLLVGYQQDSQFDIDRWILGVLQAGVDVELREVPTIPGMVPRMISGYIDAGMRSGIPEEDWGAVITVYADAERIAAFTGNENALPGRVLLLDAEGRVVFFHDRGYSAGTLMKLARIVHGGGAGPRRDRADR